MIADTGRVEAFVAALRSRIRPGHVVLDIGTGIGIWAFFACHFGARKVYAVEPQGIVHRARSTAIANGLAERIEFIQALTTEIDLPEKVDGIVADIRGSLPLFYGSLTTLIDARERFLKTGGWMIPERDVVWAALVSDARLYDDWIGFWDSRPLGIDFGTIRAGASGEWGRRRMLPDSVFGSPVKWATIDYHALSEPRVRGSLEWRIDQQVIAHGLCVWFDMEDPSGGLSNSPFSSEEHLYSQAFFPWVRPVKLGAGDTVVAELAADPVGDDYLWRWSAIVRDADGSEKANFKQSSFDGALVSADELRRRAHSHCPALNTGGEIDRMILDRFGNGSSLEQIAREVAEKFPRKFPTWERALTRVGTLSAQYSK